MQSKCSHRRSEQGQIGRPDSQVKLGRILELRYVESRKLRYTPETVADGVLVDVEELCGFLDVAVALHVSPQGFQ